MKKNTIKKLSGATITLALAGMIFVGCTQSSTSAPESTPNSDTIKDPQAYPVEAQQNTVTYIIDGQEVTLVDGINVEKIPNSSTEIITTETGFDAVGDLTGMGSIDTALLLTQDPGGSGTFWYVAANLPQKNGNIQGTNAILLGDRISPQNISIQDQTIIVNYADRPEGAPMTESPSEGKTGYFSVTEKGILVETDPPQL